MVLKVELGLDIIKTTAGKGIHKEVTGTSTPEKRALCPLSASALPSEGSSEQSRASHRETHNAAGGSYLFPLDFSFSTGGTEGSGKTSFHCVKLEEEQYS